MSSRPMILVGGKGGVGKTTCSAGIAVQSADCGVRTLIMTSDLTPSLSDIFEEPIGDKIRQIDKNLGAVEISQAAIIERWKNKFGPDFYDILSQFVDIEELDRESHHQLLDYISSAPALKEEVMMDIIHELVESGRFERVIWDTAPAGETLNLLSMPRQLRKHLKAGAKVYQLLDRLIRRRITGKRSIVEIMDRWTQLSDALAEFIQNQGAFILVATPEALVVRQAHRLIETLKGYHVMIYGMIINRVIEHPDSEEMRTLEKVQAKYQPELKEMAQGLPLATLPFSLKEIKGREALKKVGEKLVRELRL